MTDDQMRAAFEAWLNPGQHAGNVSPWVEPGRYEKDTHQLAWLAWRAATKQAAVAQSQHPALSALAIVRQYPDFDAGGPLAEMMDEVLAGKPARLLASVEALAAARRPVATQMQVLDHVESIKTDPTTLAQLRAAAGY